MQVLIDYRSAGRVFTKRRATGGLRTIEFQDVCLFGLSAARPIFKGMFMSGFPSISAADYLDTAIRNASNVVVSGKRDLERHANENRQSLSSNHERLEKLVDAALGEFIPAHEVYNDMRMAALEAVIDNHLYEADPVKDRVLLESLAQTIQAEQPRFRNPGKEQTVEPALIAGLYRQVKDLPPSALVGHRWDKTKLDGNTAGSVRGHGSPAMIHADRISNAIMPASPYYNDLRQTLFDLVRTKGATVKNWLEEEARIREEKRKPGARRFIKNEFFYHSRDAIADFDKLLLPYKRAFEAEIPPSKPISPESLVRIGRLMVAHHRTWVPIRTTAQDGQPPAKIPRLNLRDTASSLPDRVPSGIAEASRHFQPDIAAGRPKAIGFRKRLVEQVDSIFAPTASSFSKRLKLVKTIFAAREKMLSADSAEHAYRVALGNPNAKKNEATSQHQQTIRDMAETCERFVAAYEGRDPGFGLDAESVGPAAPVKRLGKQRMTANLNALKKAGADGNQLRIAAYFTSAKRSHAEMQNQTDEPATTLPGQTRAHTARTLSLKQPAPMDLRSREDERNLRR